LDHINYQRLQTVRFRYEYHAEDYYSKNNNKCKMNKINLSLNKPPSKFLLSAELEMILTDCDGSGVEGGETDSSSEKKTRLLMLLLR